MLPIRPAAPGGTLLACLLIPLQAPGQEGPPAPAGQSASALVESALRAQERRLEGVDDFTVTQIVGGQELVIHHARIGQPGEGAFHARTWVPARGAWADDLPPGSAPPSPLGLLDEIARIGAYTGTTTWNGRQVHRIDVDEMETDDFPGLGPELAVDGFRPLSASLFLDAGDETVSAVVIEGSLDAPAGPRPVTHRIEFQGYREWGPLLHPTRIVVTTEGLAETLSPEQQARARAMLADLTRQAEALPDGRRNAALAVLDEQRRRLEEILAGDPLRIVIDVVDVRVNAGPPGP